MDITFKTLDGEIIAMEWPERGVQFVSPENIGHQCPQCFQPLQCNAPKSCQTDRCVYGDARCIHCGALVGRLTIWLDTIFGLQEDDLVLNGRARVYGTDIPRQGG